MITIQSKINTVSSYPLHYPYAWEDVIFFDIETTGFSANTSFLYLIGCMYYKENTWQMTQWLADDMNSEATILLTFFETLKSYKRLIHFNGSGFDIPFIRKKCKQHNINDTFHTIESFDIYKKLLPYKRLLPLPNYKLKTIETFIGLERKDCYSGEELIQIYANYLGRIQYERLHQVINSPNAIPAFQTDKTQEISKKPLLVAPSSEELLCILLLHNSEDVKGLLQVSNILYYTDIFVENQYMKESFRKDLFNQKTFIDEPFMNTSNLNDNILNNSEDFSILLNKSCVEEECWILNFTLSYSLPFPISWQSPLLKTSVESVNTRNHNSTDIILNALNDQLTLLIPIYQGELKYFYDNYKDYYYLPKEDMALHKSVAQYVDKEFRLKAKPINCYTRKFSHFLPQPEGQLSPSFKANYADKLSYIELTNSLFEDLSTLYEYTRTLFRYISTCKETELFFGS